MKPKSTKQSHSCGDPSYPFSEDLPISHLLVLLKKLHFDKIIKQNISDPRVESSCSYTINAIIKSALSTTLFLRKSKRSYQTVVHDTLQNEANVARALGAKGDKAPCTRTIDDVLDQIDYNELNNILCGIFNRLRESKVFFNHENLCPEGMYHIAFDGETVHTYSPESAHETENCPYCLKCQRENTVWYHHKILVASLVCPGGFRLPLFVYPIHATQIHSPPDSSEERLKQECEQTAFPEVLEALRERFPCLKMCALLDSLYASDPMMNLLERYGFDYSIVFKDGSLPSVAKDCEGLKKLSEYDRQHGSEVHYDTPNHNKVFQKFTIFNPEYKGRTLNVLGFDEVVCKSNREPLSTTHWRWIVSKRLTKKNSPRTAARSRLRWNEEDIFNTVENRGFEIHHDYSRKPHTQINWLVLIMLAFSITQCFVCMRNMVKARDKLSIKDFMSDLFYQLRHCAASLIFGAAVLIAQTQLRFAFDQYPDRPP